MHFRLECRRKGFPAVVEIAGQLAEALESAGPNAAVEIDAAMKREVIAQTLRFSVSRPASDGGKRKAGSSRRHHSTSMRGVAPSLALCTRSVLLLPAKPYAVPEYRGFWSAHPGLCAVDLRLWTQSWMGCFILALFQLGRKQLGCSCCASDCEPKSAYSAAGMHVLASATSCYKLTTE